MSNMPPSSDDRLKYITLSPRTAKLLSALAIICLYLWFFLKLFLTEEASGLLVGFVGLIGIVSAIIVFLCTYSFVANAPPKDLDEREITERNSAYMLAYFYAVTLLLIGYIGSDVIGKIYSSFEMTPEVVRNFLNVAFFTCLIMPASILAWRDKTDSL